MKALTIVLFALLLGLPSVIAEQYRDFTAGMKACHESYHALADMPNKTGREAIHHAERMASIYEDMIGFWRQRNAAAAKWAEQGKAALVVLAAAAYSGDSAKADEAFATVGQTCKECHDARRVKLPDGHYEFKHQW